MTQQRQKKLQEVLASAYQEYSKGMFAYACFKINDSVTSEDLVQNAFLKAWDYLRKGGQIKAMKAFLYRTLTNLIVDQYRRRRHKSVSLEYLIEAGHEPKDNSAEAMFLAVDARTAFPLFSQLPRRYQKVLYLRFRQDMSLKEISRVTNESRNAISVQVHRGLKKLRSLYEPIT